MGRRANHRGWYVLESIPSADGAGCVDFFEDPAGGFGFELFRSDPEDGGGWTPVGGFCSQRFANPADAAAAARSRMPWLSTSRLLQDWLDSRS